MKFYTQTMTHPNGVTDVSYLRQDDDGTLWSFRENHRFYQEYLAWVAEGNEAEPWA